MSDIKITLQVIALNPDYDAATGELYTRADLGIQSKPPEDESQIAPLPPFWKYLLNIYIPKNKWNEQYKMWTRYDLTIKDTGELALTLPQEKA